MALCQSSGAWKAFFKHAPSIPEQHNKEAIRAKLRLISFDEQTMNQHIGFITVQSDGILGIEIPQLGLSRHNLSGIIFLYTSIGDDHL